MPYTPKILDVLVWPDQRLKMKCQNVTVFDDDLKHFVDDMFLTMNTYDGVALAAPQVDRQENIVVLCIEEDKPMVFINPEITVFSNDPFEWEEGCLSVPGYFKKRKRPSKIGVRFKDVNGEEQTMMFSDLYAFAIQHEVDHLNGTCFVDNISRVWHHKIKKAIKKELL